MSFWYIISLLLLKVGYLTEDLYLKSVSRLLRPLTVSGARMIPDPEISFTVYLEAPKNLKVSKEKLRKIGILVTYDVEGG